jgi:predicted secreted protein
VKHIRVFRILALAVILTLLMVVMPVTPALAAESINLVPSSGTTGDEDIEIECSGFTAGETVYFYFSSESASVDEEIDTDVINYERVAVEYDVDAAFSAFFDVPSRLTDGDEDEDVSSGTYYVYAAYDDDVIVAKDTFSVSVISVSISPVKGVVGTEVKITGSGFEGNEDIDEIRFGNSPVDISRGDEDTSSSGAFTSYILVPESAKGSYTITVEVAGDEATAKDKFTVEPAMTISPTSGAVGDSVKVTGTGFAKSKDVTITFDGDEVDITGDDATDTYGSFEATFKVPEVAPGSHDVKAEDESDNTASAKFSITTNISISPVTSQASPGYVGMEMTISGSGFKANHDITITYTSEPVVFTTTSVADGSFSYTFTIPPSGAGAHTITASDGTSSMQVTFFMESTPPPIPPPLLPMMGVKAKALAYFDWEDVTDDSNPVTYTLQIATDANFTSLLLEKTGLTTSGYTLTEAEKLESTGKEAPYYWHVRAVDAASNASVWTGAGEFYVGFAFGFPELKGWVLYALIGAGALLLFFLGFWVGRRRGGGAEY